MEKSLSFAKVIKKGIQLTFLTIHTYLNDVIKDQHSVLNGKSIWIAYGHLEEGRIDGINKKCLFEGYDKIPVFGLK